MTQRRGETRAGGTFDDLSRTGVVHLDLLRAGSEHLVKHVWLPLQHRKHVFITIVILARARTC